MGEYLEGPCPYTLSGTLKTLLRFAPQLVEHADVLGDSLWGPGRLSPRERCAMHLRLARLSRSPLALAVVPALSKVAGLSGREVDAALEGDTTSLDATTARVVAWAGAVARSRGEMPLEWPPEAREMSMRERERVLMLTRLVLVFDALVLLPIPELLLGVDPAELSNVGKK